MLALPGPITFDRTNEVERTSHILIELVAGHLKANPRVTQLRIGAHTDSMGSNARNMEISKARAFAVACALRAAGVDCTRLIPVGFGETNPIASNRTGAGRGQNRRVEVHYAAVDNTPVGGRPVDGGGQVAGDPCR